MSLSTSPEPARHARTTRTSTLRRIAPPSVERVFWVGAVRRRCPDVLWGAWERRWIADDGLIVLRTVRNLLAGNGPVFNAGERVEANTSTAWTYIVYAFSWLTRGPPRVRRSDDRARAVDCCRRHGDARHRSSVPRRSAVGGRHDPAATRRCSRLHRGSACPRLRDVRARDLPGDLLDRAPVAAAGPVGAGVDAVHGVDTDSLAFVAGLGPLVRPEMAIVPVLPRW